MRTTNSNVSSMGKCVRNFVSVQIYVLLLRSQEKSTKKVDGTSNQKKRGQDNFQTGENKVRVLFNAVSIEVQAVELGVIWDFCAIYFAAEKQKWRSDAIIARSVHFIRWNDPYLLLL